MLSLFRTNQLLACVLYIPYLVLLRLPRYIYPELQPTAFRNTFLFPEWMGYLDSNTWITEGLSFVLILSIAVMLTLSTALQRLDKEITLFPGLIYIWLSCLLPDLLHFSFLLPAVLVLWFGFDQLIRSSRGYKPIYAIFNAGFAIGVSTIFEPTVSVFLIIGLIGLNILRSFDPQELLLFLVGFICPIFLLGAILFWYDNLTMLLDYYGDAFSFLDMSVSSSLYGLLALLPYGLFLILALFSRSFYISKKLIQIRSTIRFLFWVLLGTGLVTIFRPLQLDALFLFAAPLSIMLCMNLSRLSLRMGEFIHFIALIVYAYFQYSPLIFQAG